MLLDEETFAIVPHDHDGGATMFAAKL